MQNRNDLRPSGLKYTKVCVEFQPSVRRYFVVAIRQDHKRRIIMQTTTHLAAAVEAGIFSRRYGDLPVELQA